MTKRGTSWWIIKNKKEIEGEISQAISQKRAEHNPLHTKEMKLMAAFGISVSSDDLEKIKILLAKGIEWQIDESVPSKRKSGIFEIERESDNESC